MLSGLLESLNCLVEAVQGQQEEFVTWWDLRVGLPIEKKIDRGVIKRPPHYQ